MSRFWTRHPVKLVVVAVAWGVLGVAIGAQLGTSTIREVAMVLGRGILIALGASDKWGPIVTAFATVALVVVTGRQVQLTRETLSQAQTAYTVAMADRRPVLQVATGATNLIKVTNLSQHPVHVHRLYTGHSVENIRSDVGDGSHVGGVDLKWVLPTGQSEEYRLRTNPRSIGLVVQYGPARDTMFLCTTILDDLARPMATYELKPPDPKVATHSLEAGIHGGSDVSVDL